MDSTPEGAIKQHGQKKSNKTNAKESAKKTVDTLTHDEASHKNIPTADYQSVMHIVIFGELDIDITHPVQEKLLGLFDLVMGRLNKNMVWFFTFPILLRTQHGYLTNIA